MDVGCVRIAVILLAGTFVGCIQAGPCVHTYEEDVLFIDAVLDSVSGAALTEIVITEVRLEGSAMGSLTGEGLTSLGDGTARCALPCSIGSTLEGSYEIDASADGYDAITIGVEARYGRSNGGCPSSSDDGTRVTATIDPL